MSSLLRYEVHWHCRSIDVKVTQIAMSPSAKTETDSKENQENSSKRRNYVTSIDKSQAQRGFLHHLAVWIWIGWIFFYFVLFGTLPFLYFYAPTFLTAVVWMMIFSAFMPIDERCQPKLGFQLGDFIAHKASEYFHLKMVLVDEEAVKVTGPALFAIEPHDILPLSIFAFNDCLGGLKGHKCLGCVTSICFYIPIMKHIYTWVRAKSADKNNLIDMLKKGFSPVLCPGGVQEVTLMKNENECVLYLNNRLGFIKLALQQGVPIIPCFCFGLRKTFNFWIPKNKVLTDIGRYFGVLPMVFFGVWNLPFSPGKPVDYINLIGSPIKIPKIENPSGEEIEKYHDLFIKAISKLYEEHKNEYGMGQVTLRIA